MRQKTFYNTVILSEETAIKFLQEHKLLQSEDEIGPCQRCGSKMTQKRRRTRNGEFTPVFRCSKAKCQSMRSIRSGNKFFYFTDMQKKLNCNLSLCDILEIVYLFVTETGMRRAAVLSKKSSATIIDWYNLCKEVCSKIVSVEVRGKMCGTAEDPVQINEMKITGGSEAIRSNRTLVEVNEETSNANGPWVIRLSTEQEVRFLVVDKRDAVTLIPMIKREVAPKSHIETRKLIAYKSLKRHGFVHRLFGYDGRMPKQTAKWFKVTEVVRKFSGTTRPQLCRHLDYISWLKLRRKEDCMFLAFLKDMRTAYHLQSEKTTEDSDESDPV